MSKQLTLSETVRNTNFKRLDTSSLSDCQMKVFDVIEKHYPTAIPDKVIAEDLGWPIHCVTGRRWELVNVLGLVESTGVEYYPDHNGKMRSNTLWSLAGV